MLLKENNMVQYKRDINACIVCFLFSPLVAILVAWMLLAYVSNLSLCGASENIR